MNRLSLALLASVAASLLVVAVIRPLAAQNSSKQNEVPSGPIAVFNFDSDAEGLTTPFTNTVQALTATFSSPADPGGFGVGPTFFAPPMSGNVLLDPSTSGASFIPMKISFNKNLDSIYLFFATDGTGTFYLTAYDNSKEVGSATATGIVPSGYSFPQGVISLSGVTFNSVVLSSPQTPNFAIDNVGVSIIRDVPQVSRPRGIWPSGPELLQQ